MTIASEISRLQWAKADICTAIENKGVTVWSIKLDQYCDCINAIPTWWGLWWAFCYLIVWWWWWGANLNWWWWGAVCTWFAFTKCSATSVIVWWCWLWWFTTVTWWNGLASSIGTNYWTSVASTVVAPWGCWAVNSANCGCSWSWYLPWNKWSDVWGWGWGAWWAGCNAWTYNLDGSCCSRWGWAWWPWLCWYWGWGWWWACACNYAMWGCVVDWWGCWWWCVNRTWGSATNCGWWWWGWSWSYCWGRWACWLVEIWYPANWAWGVEDATWWTKSSFEEWWVTYCKHRFTTTWTFFIWSWNLPAWIYYNASSCLITMSCDGNNWLTIQDRNIWATTRDVKSSTSYWCMYQWGNNYWFVNTWTVSRTTTKVDTTWYWPWNYYSRNCFVYDSTSCNLDWSNPSNDNLWGNTTNTYAARQWPAPSWYHVPSQADISCMVKVMRCIKWWDLTLDEVQQYLFIPLSWYRGYASGCLYCQWSGFGLWMSSTVNWLWYCAWWIYTNSNVNSSTYWNRRWTWYPIRAFKNVASIPNASWWAALISM